MGRFFRIAASMGAISFSSGIAIGEMLTVEECIQIALNKNFDIRISQNTTKRAEQDVEIANAEFEPSFGITTSDSFNTQVRSGDRLDGAAQPQSRPAPELTQHRWFAQAWS